MNALFNEILVVVALAAEVQDEFVREGVAVLYTGVGKINAAYALTRRLGEYRSAGLRLPLVVNFGSAGSPQFPSGTLVSCHQFLQRDMDVTGLGFPLGATPFEEIPPILEFPRIFPELPAGVCASGDCFEAGTREHHHEVVDMEAFALAKVCWLEGAQFACAKYISDGADHSAAADWQNNVHRAAAEFARLYRQLRERTAV
jgi:adenosylhomocysteine nucleosidase